MNENDYLLLDRYFNGLLSPEEAAQVRARTEVDTVFKDAFHLRLDMENFTLRAEKRKAFSATLERVGADYFQTADVKPLRGRLSWARWAAVAAGLALLLGVWWWMSQQHLPTYEQYADHAPLSLTVRGAADQAKFDAEAAFSRQDYAGALPALEQIVQAEPENLIAKFYQGICLLETNQGAKARDIWAPIAAGASALKSEAQWYIALSYLKEKNLSACQTALQAITPDAERFPDAQRLLKTL